MKDLPSIIKEEDVNSIIGKTVVKQDEIVGYTIDDMVYNKDISWEIIDKYHRVKILEIMDNNRICKVYIPKGTVKPFTVKYGEYSLDVIIDWKKSSIIGPELVYPYDICEYKIDTSGIELLNNDDIIFKSTSDLIKIDNISDGKCKVEILTGKTGSFTLDCYKGNELIDSLFVKIGSL